MLICPFTMKIYHRFLSHVIFYFKTYEITGKSKFQGKATLVSVVAGYRNTTYIYKIQYKDLPNMHTSASVCGTLFSLL